MRLEIDLEIIAKLAEDRKSENIAFQSYLKTQDNSKIDTIVQDLNNTITPKIDCLKCGNCCMNLRPIATNSVLSKFLESKDIEKFKYAESFTCTHLLDKKCTKYLERPDECRAYPYMDKKNYISRTHGILQNYEICPIVFNIFEALKINLAWQY